MRKNSKNRGIAGKKWASAHSYLLKNHKYKKVKYE